MEGRVASNSSLLKPASKTYDSKPMFRRVAPSLLLLLTWFALGTGLMAHLHNLDHAEHDHDHDASPFRHDDTNCRLHAQLHTPALAVAAPLPALVIQPSCELAALPPQQSHISLVPTPRNPRAPPAS